MSNQDKILFCNNIAIAFGETGINCNELDREAQNSSVTFMPDAFFTVPAIVNLVFSCELSLKAMILLENKNYQREHNLCELFNMLSDNRKQQIRLKYDRLKKNTMDFDEVLRIHQNAFTRWRYAFENPNESIEAYPDNLILAARVLMDNLSRKDQAK